MLDGKTIAITRSKDDAAEFISLVEQNNATPIALPTIELVSKGEKIVDEFLNLVDKSNPDYSVFLSSKAVKILFDTAKNTGKFEKLHASNSFLKELLNKIGIDVVELHLYNVCVFKDTTQWNGFRELFSQNKVHGVIFTSASSVRGFFEIMSKDYSKEELQNNLSQVSLISIGTFTSEELTKFDVPFVVSEIHTVAGAFDTLNDVLTME